jgi:hypothetical protein
VSTIEENPVEVRHAGSAQDLGEDSRSIREIESDMEATRERLTRTVTELQETVSPAAIKQRAMDRVHGFFFDEYGGIRPERVAITVGAVLAVILLRQRD